LSEKLIITTRKSAMRGTAGILAPVFAHFALYSKSFAVELWQNDFGILASLTATFHRSASKIQQEPDSQKFLSQT